MVDPNRKINRPNREDERFLQELEDEFCNRFTSEDKQFQEFIERKTYPPPIVENWEHRNDNHGRGGRSNWNRYDHRSRPYYNNRNSSYRDNRGRGRGGRGAFRGGNYNDRQYRQTNYVYGESSGRNGTE